MVWEADEEAEDQAERRQKSKVLGVVGLSLLFGGALTLSFGPEAWQFPVLGMMVVGVLLILGAWNLVR